MWYPYVIGRDGWVWVEQQALYVSVIPPTKWGEEALTGRDAAIGNSTGGVRAWVIVVVVVVVDDDDDDDDDHDGDDDGDDDNDDDDDDNH